MVTLTIAFTSGAPAKTSVGTSAMSTFLMPTSPPSLLSAMSRKNAPNAPSSPAIRLIFQPVEGKLQCVAEPASRSFKMMSGPTTATST